ncbi:hypothetical protein [Lysinibacillus sp. NPDC056232]|uniref:hypothetical protein n=1 Tax=Lysinibacillus sp. NPDC056232 TaxID=3345756 RepID=UPI0035E2F551
MGISVTDETLERSEAAHRTPQEALLCAKAKRQRQSDQPERKSTHIYTISLICKNIIFIVQYSYKLR